MSYNINIFKIMRHFYLKITLIFFCALVLGNTLIAQNDDIFGIEEEGVVEEPTRFVASVYYNGLFPQSRFKENLNTTYHGIGADILYRFNKKAPIYVGIGLNGFAGPRESIEYQEEIDGEFFTTREITSANIVNANVLVRFMPDLYRWYEPFGEFHIGYKFLFSLTEFKDVDADDVFDSFFEETDFSLSFGLGGGCNFYLFKNAIKITTKLTYSRGLAANYHVRSSTVINPGNPIDYYEIRTSATDAIIFQLGALANF
jgi:hypothetical protein